MTIRENNLHVTNTLTRQREKFEPLSPSHVGMYVCGPTVYGDAHLGHAKSYISFDVIVRFLRHLGYDVTYVQNITDVGHLTDDADAGEDKVEKAARAKKVHPMQIAEQFTRRYFEDMDRLNVLRPDISPRASSHVIEQIEHAKRLIQRGHAYEANGSVYFDVASWPNYGRLSGRSVDEMLAGARVEMSAEKRHPADFALWKRAEPGHIMQWPSPWGMGYPGWHIECTVMGQKYLGGTLDIHGGGIENVFPHHEDEIAQAEAATGKPFVKYWLHNNMVTVAGKKMGKSLGNFLTLRDAFAKWPPMVIRLFILQSHYRSPTDFSPEALEAAKEGWHRLRDTALGLENLGYGGGLGGEAEPSVVRTVEESRRRFHEAMDDDFATASALAVLFDLVREANRVLGTGGATHGTAELLRTTFAELGGDILGLDLEFPEEGIDEGLTNNAFQILIALRNEARHSKNFAQADAIRKRLDEIGIVLEDTKEGTKWRFK
ncbi:MAG TPA: cysteine--tRNA ligase [Phycisphaerae bacterium]|nr:cysteine--tRNA ligase [Phycisphaerae bacterium]